MTNQDFTGISYSNSFAKSFKKRIAHNKKLVNRFEERVQLFIENRNNPILCDHKLIGSKKDFRAFSINGDIRVIYKEVPPLYIFVDIGTHAQVYDM